MAHKVFTQLCKTAAFNKLKPFVLWMRPLQHKYFNLEVQDEVLLFVDNEGECMILGETDKIVMDGYYSIIPFDLLLETFCRCNISISPLLTTECEKYFAVFRAPKCKYFTQEKKCDYGALEDIVCIPSYHEALRNVMSVAYGKLLKKLESGEVLVKEITIYDRNEPMPVHLVEL